MLIQQLTEDNLITKEDVAAEIHSMHPSFLDHQLQSSLKNLNLQTIDLMYIHNAYESWSHFVTEEQFLEKLAKTFEFYESKRQQGQIQYYGMATWLCFRAKPEEEKIYLNFQKMFELAQKVGGDNHGFRFIQVPMGVMMPEAFVEPWQHYLQPDVADPQEEMKVLIAVCNLLKMNVMISKPILEGAVKEIKIDSIKNITDPVAKHLQLVRSMPPRCIISTMCGMKSLNHLKSNFDVIKNEPLTREEFLKAMNVKK